MKSPSISYSIHPLRKAHLMTFWSVWEIINCFPMDPNATTWIHRVRKFHSPTHLTKPSTPRTGWPKAALTSRCFGDPTTSPPADTLSRMLAIEKPLKTMRKWWLGWEKMMIMMIMRFIANFIVIWLWFTAERDTCSYSWGCGKMRLNNL